MSDSNNDRQSEVAAETGNTSLELWHTALKSQRQIPNYRRWRAQAKWLRQWRRVQIARLALKKFILPFPVVGHCRNCPGHCFFSSSTWLETPDLSLEFWSYICHIVPDIFPVWRPICYFRLSVVVAITGDTFVELAMVDNAVPDLPLDFWW